MPTKLELTILGRIAYFINGLKGVNRCFIVVIARLSEISQHPACMDTIMLSRTENHLVIL